MRPQHRGVHAALLGVGLADHPGAREVAAVAAHRGAAVDAHHVARGKPPVGRLRVRKRAVGACGHDRREGRLLRAAAPHLQLQLQRDVALGRSGARQAGGRLQRVVDDAGGGLDAGDLLRSLAPAPFLHQPFGRHEAGASGIPEPVQHAGGDALRLVSDAGEAPRAAGLADHLGRDSSGGEYFHLPVRALGGRLFLVAPVGDQHALAARDQQRGRAAGETTQVADVGSRQPFAVQAEQRVDAGITESRGDRGGSLAHLSRRAPRQSGNG